MATVSRLGGALLVETQERYFIVGEPKRPIDWEQAGFAIPSETLDPPTSERIPWFELKPSNARSESAPLSSEIRMNFPLEGVPVLEALHEKLIIERNGSVSERLWNLLIENGTPTSNRVLDARWLAEIPSPIWGVVRDSLLRCS